MSARCLASLATAVTALTGCGNALSPEECYRARPVISVSSGTTPEFTWSPKCPIAALEVSNAWYVYAVDDRNNGITAPVRYNAVPVGARQGCPCPPVPLQVGTQYLVTLSRWERLSDGGSALLHWADASFAP